MNFRKQLIDMDACAGAVEWVDTQTIEQAWTACERGDWMLWLGSRIAIDCKLLVLAACACAEPALAFVPVHENRPRRAIEVARAWCAGTATLSDVRAVAAFAAASASAAASDAAFAASAAAAASDAAFAASAAAASAYAAYASAYAAADAAYAASASASATYASYASAYAESLRTSAATIRAMIPLAAIVEAFDRRFA